jgi:hypothetical protein
MSTTDRCHREDELLDALGRGFVGPELTEHTASCDFCSELHLVAGALLDDRSHAVAEAPLPSSGTMWWRLRVRHRHDAEASARRSLMIGQALTLAIALGLVITFFGSEVTGAVRHVIATIRVSTPLLLAFAAWVLVAPIAGWVALRQK